MAARWRESSCVMVPEIKFAKTLLLFIWTNGLKVKIYATVKYIASKVAFGTRVFLKQTNGNIFRHYFVSKKKNIFVNSFCRAIQANSDNFSLTWQYLLHGYVIWGIEHVNPVTNSLETYYCAWNVPIAFYHWARADWKPIKFGQGILKHLYLSWDN